MSENKKTLNRGLDALLGSGGKAKRTIQDVNLTQINAGRFQPREIFNEESLQELTDSIKKHGVISPILVRELGLNKYEVIAGERRMRASLQAGLETYPVLG
jgi:ParB family chromosome partitioning protein